MTFLQQLRYSKYVCNDVNEYHKEALSLSSMGTTKDRYHCREYYLRQEVDLFDHVNVIVGLFVRQQHISNSYGRILTKFLLRISLRPSINRFDVMKPHPIFYISALYEHYSCT